MQFKTPYVLAMREQSPKMFNRLIRAGLMEAHLQQKVAEAYRMFEELTADAPKLDNGLPTLPHRTRAEQIVLETLIEFPPEEPTRRTDPLVT